MIASIFHQGSGLGNQLHRYIATRCIAKDKGYNFGMFYPENFKGKDFMNLDMGIEVNEDRRYWRDEHMFEENKVLKGNLDVRSYDPEVNFIKDFTVIDGEFQDPRYFEHHLDEILGWLNIKPELMAEFYGEVCVIAFRGGEYTLFPDLFLPQAYWDMAIKKMRAINPNMVFKVVTDDVETARKFFPDFEITHNVADDWTSILVADYLILSNSSFSILPALLNKKVKKIIAPRFWARYNTKTWALPQNYYKQFEYIHHEMDN